MGLGTDPLHVAVHADTYIVMPAMHDTHTHTLQYCMSLRIFQIRLPVALQFHILALEEVAAACIQAGLVQNHYRG